MDKNKNDNYLPQIEELSKGNAFKVKNSKRAKIKKVLLAIAVVTVASGAFAQTNNLNNTKSQEIKNKNSLDKDYNHPDGYMMQNGKVVMFKNGVITPLEKDVTLSNGTIIYRDGSYLLKGGTKTMFKEGEHMDMNGQVMPMDKSKNHDKSKTGKSLKKDTMYWINDSTKNKIRKK